MSEDGKVPGPPMISRTWKVDWDFALLRWWRRLTKGKR